MLRRNVVANFLGQAWSGLLNIAFVPVYVHYLGIEAYGLVGFLASLQATLSALDLGLSTTANREIAQRSRREDLIGEGCDLVRTLEVFYGAEALLIALALYVLSDWIATQWLNMQTIAVETARLAVVVFGITLALRWPVSLYVGTLRGLEKQVLLNKITIGIAGLKYVGTLSVLAFVSPTVLAFLIWQLVTAIAEVLLMANIAWLQLPQRANRRVKFEIKLLAAVWRFSLQLAAISVFAALLKQLDKLLISKLLPLDQVGYYTAANTASNGLIFLVTPIFNAIFPRFTSLISGGDTETLAEAYHKATRFASFLVVPVSSILVFFSFHVLLLWTRSESIAANAGPTLSVLAFAGMLNSIMQFPYALQLASGLTWVALWNNGLSVIALAPLTFILVSRFGIVGGGIAWAIFNISYYLVIPQVMHRYILPGHKRAWILNDTLPFIILGLSVFGIAYVIATYIGNIWLVYLTITLAFLLYFFLCLFLFPSLRSWLLSLYRVWVGQPATP